MAWSCGKHPFLNKQFSVLPNTSNKQWKIEHTEMFACVASREANVEPSKSWTICEQHTASTWSNQDKRDIVQILNGMAKKFKHELVFSKPDKGTVYARRRCPGNHNWRDGRAARS